MLITNIRQSGLVFEASVSSAVPKRDCILNEAWRPKERSDGLIFARTKILQEFQTQSGIIPYPTIVSFYYDIQWKYLWHFILLKRSNTIS